MSELNKQLTITSLYEFGDGNMVPLRQHLANILKDMDSPIAAFNIESLRLVSYGLVDGSRYTAIPGTGLLESADNHHIGSLTYQLTNHDDISLVVSYNPSTQSVKVHKSKDIADIELAITITARDFKRSPDGFLYINIPVRNEFHGGNCGEYRGLTIEHGSFEEDGSLIKGTWEMEHGSFEPAFDSKGNIIAFNLVNKPQ